MKGNKKKASLVLLSSTLLLTMLFVTMPTSLFAAENNANIVASPRLVDVVINPTNFPDTEFRTYVKGFDNNPIDNKLSETELGNVLTISVNRKTGTKISSLKGIEYFTKITALECNENLLTSLDVSKNTLLTKLYCGGNQLTSLDVSKNTALNTFNCSPQNRTLTYDKNKGYLLSAYDTGFVKGNASNFVGPTYNDGTLSGVKFNTPFTYKYNTGCNSTFLEIYMDVTLTFDEPTEISRLEDAKILAEKAIAGISATNETTNKIILDAVIKSVSSVDGVSAAWKAGSPTITLATKDTAGSITGTIILTCGSKTKEVTVNKQIGKLPTPTPDKPTISAGNNGANHQVNTSNDMTFTCSSRLEDLNGVYVDGKLVAESNYTLKSGSTILTLKSSYLDTLSVGKHILKFQYKDNVAAETDFTITAKSDETTVKPSTPNTEDKPAKPSTPNTGDTTAKPSTPNTGDTSVKPGVTNTGDASNTMLCFGLMILSGCLAGYSLKKKKALRS